MGYNLELQISTYDLTIPLLLHLLFFPTTILRTQLGIERRQDVWYVAVVGVLLAARIKDITLIAGTAGCGYKVSAGETHGGQRWIVAGQIVGGTGPATAHG